MHSVFNANIGNPYDFFSPPISATQTNLILAELFEQYLIFDNITVAVGRDNTQLEFLIKNLGLSSVDQLVRNGNLKFCLWTPVIVSSIGREMKNGKIDESVIYGKPPIIAGSWSQEDLDPENNIKKALDKFHIHELRKKQFIRMASDSYIIPDGMQFSKNATDIVYSAYEKNTLSNLGLPFTKTPEQFNISERRRIADLSYKVLETAILSEYNLKSYENFEAYEICKANLANIGRAYNISENTSQILKLHNLPDFKSIFLTGKMDFLAAFRIREYRTAQYYRNWINNIGETSNINEVTNEYLKELDGDKKFFQSNSGRFIKNLVMFGIGGLLGSKLAELPLLGAVSGYSLGLFDEFILGNLLKGKNPSMFIKEIDYEISPPATLYSK